MLSYTRGPKGTIVRKTIGEVFLETATRFAERIALISRHENIRLTWAEYAHQAQRVAAGLRALGLNAGDRVVVEGTVKLHAGSRVVEGGSAPAAASRDAR